MDTNRMDRLIAGLLLIGWLIPVFAQEAAVAPAPAAEPPAVAEPAPAADKPEGPKPDARMYAPPWMRAREQFKRDRETLDKARAPEIKAVLQTRLNKADEQEADARRVRNITGIRVATEFKAILQNAALEAEAGKTIEWPEDVRREIRPMLDEVKGAVGILVGKMDARTAELCAAQFERFSAAYRAAGLPETEALRDLFEVWLAQEPPSKEPAPAAPETAAETPPETPAMAPAPEPPKEFFAERGKPAGDWITVGRWFADMQAPESFQIPIYGRASDVSGSQANPISTAVTTWTWEASNALPAGVEYAFRLRRIEEREPVQLINWPGTNGTDHMDFRTAYSSRIPSPVGFELQAAPLEDTRKLELEAYQLELASNGVLVTISTVPPGAKIGVDGKLYRLPSGEPALTPCEILLLPGATRLTLVLPEHVRYDNKEFLVRPGARVSWRFQSETDLPGTKVKVNARTPWSNSGVSVKRGEKIWVVPFAGTWVVGGRGEPCGTEGYDEAKFAHYYTAGDLLGKKQLPDAPYGALIGRIGGATTGKIISLAGRTSFVADSTGELWLDANEATDSALRRDNRGTVEVNVIAVPAP